MPVTVEASIDLLRARSTIPGKRFERIYAMNMIFMGLSAGVTLLTP